MRDAFGPAGLPDHAGLCYELAAPLKEGKLDPDRSAPWLKHLESLGAPEGYAAAFRRFRDSFGSGAEIIEMRTEGRLLVGHGLEAPTEVGLSLCHTWGVPLIPASALKGVAAHYMAEVYAKGIGEPAKRADCVGPRWQEGRLVAPPGLLYQAIFGAPAREADDQGSRGLVEFHDALPLPGGAMLARDVLTVHQRGYYGGSEWPNDYEGPNPVTFVSVKPGVLFLVVLSLQAELPRAMKDRGWTGAEVLAAAKQVVLGALGDWGVGGKTRAGYGRLIESK